jgi:hypothetical protein
LAVGGERVGVKHARESPHRLALNAFELAVGREPTTRLVAFDRLERRLQIAHHLADVDFLAGPPKPHAAALATRRLDLAELTQLMDNFSHVVCGQIEAIDDVANANQTVILLRGKVDQRPQPVVRESRQTHERSVTTESLLWQGVSSRAFRRTRVAGE